MPTHELNALKDAGILTESAIFDLQQRSRVPTAAFTPKAPRSLEEAGISEHLVESLVLKFLQNRGAATGQESPLRFDSRFESSTGFSVS